MRKEAADNNVNHLVSDMLESTVLWGSEDPQKRLPFQAFHQSEDSRVVVVTGPNCSGKSLLAESLRAYAKQAHKLASVSVSIRERTGAGLFEMAAMRRAMMFGDETQQSTGATSVRVVDKAFATIAHHLEEKAVSRNFLMLDEPELGLSEGYCVAMGKYLALKVQEMPSACWGLVLVTHSKPLVDALQAALPDEQRPGFVHMGSRLSLSEWTGSLEAFSIEQLLALSEQDHTLRREVGKKWG